MPDVRAAIQRDCHDLEKWVTKSISHPKHWVVRDELGFLLPTENGEAIEATSSCTRCRSQSNSARVQV